MRVQRYDVPDINNPGKFIPRYWDPSHTPVLDEQVDISYIIQLANNVTDKILTERALLNSQLEQTDTMEQMKALNEELLLTNVQLRETQQNLYTLNAQLEERVAKRTQELADSYNEQQTLNKELAATNEEHATVNQELTDIQQRLVDTNVELETSSSRLRMAIESTQLGTWDYNPVSGELYWSKECRDIYGIPQELKASFELYAQLLHPGDSQWVLEQIAACIQPDLKGRYDLSYRINRYDSGETRWVKVKGTVYFEEEQATRFIGTVLDITEMKLAQEESAKLAAIIASSDDAIVSKTLDSVITSWNQSAERMFGFTAEEMIGESIYKLIPPDRTDEEPLILSRLKSGQRVEHFETKRLTKDGRQIDVSVSVSPIKDKDGRIIGLSKIARDITERKQDEARKSDFIGMVSHELKTPLTSLNALLQVAELKLKTSEDSFLPGAMQKANVEVKKMTNMINGFLNVSRLESAKILIEKEPFQLEELITEVVDETNLTVGSRQIDFDPCPPVTIKADRDKISSVISNLIGNAVKYSPNGAAIAVKCELIGQNVVFSVKDQGLGIAEADVKKIFDRYYRVQSNHSKHISGFGIGLYLSAEIIDRHDGKIWVESEMKKGSTFYFSLPL
ncbi:PAS domain S-box protein [Mucilaginibacter sp. SMC90]|uniref:PAS domain-containing sensor histidine kinase n=1 Tax=Mucilaginibacter sp. SMC90 TaxID=2929803 RepID=UPI001FB3B5E6|nr:PAS domain-containing sensor histidine kinase [Mucilaginibacter sp. SMC90]UOE52493.1 PAS domain S-box protein [Mucilaginibacter sp. SMC90]